MKQYSISECIAAVLEPVIKELFFCSSTFKIVVFSTIPLQSGSTFICNPRNRTPQYETWNVPFFCLDREKWAVNVAWNNLATPVVAARPVSLLWRLHLFFSKASSAGYGRWKFAKVSHASHVVPTRDAQIQKAHSERRQNLRTSSCGTCGGVPLKGALRHRLSV